MEIHVCKICKSCTTFRTINGVEGTIDLAHCKAFLFEVLLIACVIVLLIALLGMRYIGQILFSGGRMNYELFHI